MKDVDLNALRATLRSLQFAKNYLDEREEDLNASTRDAFLRDIRLFGTVFDSMTDHERACPRSVDVERLKRIAAGSGIPVDIVGQVLSQLVFIRDASLDSTAGLVQRKSRNMGGV